MEAVEEPYTVDDTPLNACGEIRARLRLGDRRKEETQVTFQVVEGITDNILSVNRTLDVGANVYFEQGNCVIQWADGRRATFTRNGRNLLPREELEQPKAWQAKIATLACWPNSKRRRGLTDHQTQFRLLSQIHLQSMSGRFTA